MKQILKRILYKFGVKPSAYIDVCFRRDCSLYKANSSMSNDSLDSYAARIRVISHTIEKALSLSKCRTDFGVDKVKNLIILLKAYKENGGMDNNAIRLAENIIYVYYRFRKSHGLDTSFIPQGLVELHDREMKCGAMPYVENIEDFKHFKVIAESRHSIRNYSDVPIREIDVQRAVSIAQTAPSACNRQATRIYAITDKDKIGLLKQRHGGIRSFGQPSVIFAIVQDLSMYLNEYERNTWLVDGGIFCMNLLYALNSVGIVNCPVIWGGMDDEDEFIADLIGLKPSERVAILVVGGYSPEDGVRTPCSPKRPLEDVLKFVK